MSSLGVYICFYVIFCFDISFTVYFLYTEKAIQGKMSLFSILIMAAFYRSYLLGQIQRVVGRPETKTS